MFQNRTVRVIVLSLLCLAVAVGADHWRETTRADFLDGTGDAYTIVTPDPDGMDNGAVQLAGDSVTIRVLQVYPDSIWGGINSHQMAEEAIRFSHDGTPPVTFIWHFMSIEQWNRTTNLYTDQTVNDYIHSTTEWHPVVFYDVVYFGEADVFGYQDLDAQGVENTKAFARESKAIIMTHSTVWERQHSLPYYEHAGFNSLYEIHGMHTYPQTTYITFTEVSLTAGSRSDPVTFLPFYLPDTFSVGACHMRGQLPELGTTWYQRLYPAPSDSDAGIYLYTFLNDTLHSFFAFFEYGHAAIETSPPPRPNEFEAKSFINCAYRLYQRDRLTGYYISSVVNLGGDAALGNFTVSHGIAPPTGNIIYSAQFSSDGTIWSPWEILTPGSPPSVPRARLIQYRVDLMGDMDHLPIVHWVDFEYWIGGPRATLITPLEGQISSCAGQPLVIAIADTHGVDPATILLQVNGMGYMLTDPQLQWDGSHLTYRPNPEWVHGQTVVWRLEAASDIHGNQLEAPIEGTFRIDLTPPVGVIVFPRDSSFFISADQVDTLHVLVGFDVAPPVWGDFTFRVNGFDYRPGDGFLSTGMPYDSAAMTWYPLTLVWEPPARTFNFDLSIQGAADGPDLCDTLRMAPLAWRFYLGSLTFGLPETLLCPGDSAGVLLSLDNAGGLNLSGLTLRLLWDRVIADPVLGTFALGNDSLSVSAAGDTVILRLFGAGGWTDRLECPVPLRLRPTARAGEYTVLRFLSADLPGLGGRIQFSDGLLLVCWQRMNWTVDLTFVPTDTWWHSNYVTIGVTSSATDLWDDGMDRVSVVAPPNVVEAYLPLNDPAHLEYPRLNRDVRSSLDLPVTWKIVVERAEGVLQWGSAYLPPGEFTLNGFIDMRRQDSAPYPLGDTVFVTFDQPTIAPARMTVSTGWNLVSLGIVPISRVTATQIFPDYAANIYGYDAFRRGYVREDTLVKGYGYWLLADNPQEVLLAGSPVTTYRVRLNTGWNLIGGGAATRPLSELVLDPPEPILTSYRWDAAAHNYMATDSLSAFEGLWILVRSPAELTFPR